jgi:hypothetical protein
MVTGLGGNSYEEKCKEIGIKTLRERRQYQDLVLLHGMVHGRGGLKLEDMFKRAHDRDGPRTRQVTGVNNLKIPAARSEIRKNSFAVRVVKEWNELPDILKSCTDTKKFKMALRKHRD